MLDLLKDIHNKSEQMSGRKILLSFVAIFIIFLSLGLIIGNINNSRLKENEMGKDGNEVKAPVKLNSYEGKIEYLNPSFYPEDELSYVLVDSSGKQIILLRSKDQKLNIAEGLFVEVRGTETKTKDGKNSVLIVSEVIIKNATD